MIVTHPPGMIAQLLILALLLATIAAFDQTSGKDQASGKPTGRAVRMADAIAVDERSSGIKIFGVVQAKGPVEIASQLGGLKIEVSPRDDSDTQ